MKFLAALVIAFLDRAVGAFVLAKVWTWWVVPFWPTAPALSWRAAIGVGIFAGALQMGSTLGMVRIIQQTKTEEHPWADVGYSLMSVLVLWPVCLGTAWVWRWLVLL